MQVKYILDLRLVCAPTLRSTRNIPEIGLRVTRPSPFQGLATRVVGQVVALDAVANLLKKESRQANVVAHGS